MTPEEAAKVLAVAVTFDSRLNPQTPGDARLRAQAWSAALNSSMPPEWAQKAVVGHYSASREAIMPAHLNEAWKAHRATERAREDNERLRAQRGLGVPMPAELRGAIRALGQRQEDHA